MHGHAAGDRVLEQIGARLTALVRRGDYVARWGGEEFLLVFRPLPRGSMAGIGERLCAEIRGHAFCLDDGSHCRLTAKGSPGGNLIQTSRRTRLPLFAFGSPTASAGASAGGSEGSAMARPRAGSMTGPTPTSIFPFAFSS